MSCDESTKLATFSFLLIVIIDFRVLFVRAESTQVINTTSGPVQGGVYSNVNSVKYSAFTGIRYAEPPVGYLRFKPPVAVDRSTEILNATVEGSDCPQRDFMTGQLTGSEDCLFINVYTPVTNFSESPMTLKSVMVWIHGGGFTTGTSSNRLYKPDYIIEKDVVYVALNYRLGALGFINLHHPNATGNAGLKDQLLALKWVRNNIEKFGGNPENVTIFGQSAGSASVGYHVLSDASTGLFHGAIMMSGVPLNPWAFQTREQAFAQARRLGAHLGIGAVNKETLLKSLYSVSADDIVNATSEISVVPFVPTLEDEDIASEVFLSTCSVTKYMNGNYSKVPQMLGFTDQETLAFVGVAEPFLTVARYAIDFADEIFLPLPPGLRTVEKLMKMGVNVYEVISKETLMLVVNETTDILFTAQIDWTQKYLVNNVYPVYYYHLSFYTNMSVHRIFFNSTLEGAGHADDVAYIFYIPSLNYSTDPTDPVARTIHRYSTMWTNFAKYGNPTPDWIQDSDLNVTWPHSGQAGTSLDIGTELTVGPRPVRGGATRVEILSEPHLGTMNGCRKRSFKDILWETVNDIIHSNHR